MMQMKPGRTDIFVLISAIALFFVLMVQVNWIFEAANIKKELFNEKANIVLARTTEALNADKETCQQMENGVGKDERRKIDSLIRHFMNFYNFHIDYTFEVLKPISNLDRNLDRLTDNVYPDRNAGCYVKNLEETTTKNGFELKLNFPKKEKFIREEMGTMFVTSILLILVVMVLFWRTIKSLIREKKISEHTTDFLNNMTHEFKTPLTNIALAGKMMTRDASINDEDKIKHYSAIILEENEKLRLQVEHVLSMTALERGEIPLQKSELDLHQLLRDVLKNMSVQIENRQGDLKLQLEAAHTTVFGDKEHLANALRNLVDNAIKYSKEKLQVTIQTCNADKNLVIKISDNGIGIKKEHQGEVFTKFFRVPTGDVHDVKGFGLGLAYVKKIIEMHEGKIELESEEGKGASFVITLPVQNG